MSGDLNAMAGFVTDTGATAFEHVPDIEGEIWGRFGVRSQQTYIFINDDGTYRVSGYGTLRDDVQGLIGS